MCFPHIKNTAASYSDANSYRTVLRSELIKRTKGITIFLFCRFRTEDDAIRMANDTYYGLSGISEKWFQPRDLWHFSITVLKGRQAFEAQRPLVCPLPLVFGWPVWRPMSVRTVRKEMTCCFSLHLQWGPQTNLESGRSCWEWCSWSEWLRCRSGRRWQFPHASFSGTWIYPSAHLSACTQKSAET